MTMSDVFADVHHQDGQVRATLRKDPSVRGLETAIYMDGSQSMSDEYGHARLTTKLWNWLHLKPGDGPNIVEPEIQRMLQYLATKDRNGQLRVAYWACGNASTIEVVGELTAADVGKVHFPGPQHFGATYLKPALEDFVAYMREQATQGAERGCAVFVTDGKLFDDGDVHAYSEEIELQILQKSLPPLHLILVGVGEEIDEEQLDELARAHPKLWAHKSVKEMHEIPALVALLVDERLTITKSGRILDHRGTVIQVIEGRLPAVLEFPVPEGCTGFTLEIDGQTYEKPLN